jgi:hypothetical protein
MLAWGSPPHAVAQDATAEALLAEPPAAQIQAGHPFTVAEYAAPAALL